MAVPVSVPGKSYVDTFLYEKWLNCFSQIINNLSSKNKENHNREGGFDTRS